MCVVFHAAWLQLAMIWGGLGTSFLAGTEAQSQEPASLERLSDDPVQLERSLLEEESSRLAVSAKEFGDARRGASIFFSPRTACAQCHWSSPNVGPGSRQFEREAKGVQSIGPDLAEWKRVVTDAELIDSVLRPSQFIHEDYRATTIVTDSGRIVTGIVIESDEEKIRVRRGASEADIETIAKDEIVQQKVSELSLMPAGQVQSLSSKQDFFDMMAFLIAIRDGGQSKLRQLAPPNAMQLTRVPEYERSIDHAGFIREWNQESYQRGEKIYQRVCKQCHGTLDEPGSLPTALRFAQGHFKSGSDPYSMYRTLTYGSGMMTAQNWMVPAQKYDVIHFIQQHFVEPHNKKEFIEWDEKYLSSIPRGDQRGPEPREFEPWRWMNYGDMMMTTIEFGSGGNNIAQKAIAVRLDGGDGGISRGQSFYAFEHDTLRMAGLWSGAGFINWQGIQFDGAHGIHPQAVGDLLIENPTGPGWANPKTGRFDDDQRVVGRDGKRYGPLPESWGKFRSLYRFESQVLLKYTVGDCEILELPGMSLARGTNRSGEALSGQYYRRSLEIGPHDKPLRLLAMTLRPEAMAEVKVEGNVVVSRSGAVQFLMKAAGAGSQYGQEASSPIRFAIEEDRVVLEIPKAEESTVIHLGWLWAAEERPLLDTDLGYDFQQQLSEVPSPSRLLEQASTKRWPEQIETKPSVWFESKEWRVDDLSVPETNPWLARVRVTGFDFSEDGDTVFVCTWDGDVWRATGVRSLETSEPMLTWHRIAAGLFQPLGIMVSGDSLMVTCRDQLMHLVDHNRDGEMDEYRCFNSDHQVTEHFHEFAMGLQRDSIGNWYYAKSARHALKAVVPHHGTLLKVSPDGKSTEIVARGFRAANGVCLNPDGSFIVTDQEGHWNPKNRINWVRSGGFYGNMFGYHDVTDSSDDVMEQPLCWITNEFDRSPAELLWCNSPKWGKLNGQLLNLSYGYGRIYVVPHEFVDRIDKNAGTPSEVDRDGQPQGAMCQLPIPDLPTGIIRGRFSPHDQQLYVGGMFAWASSRPDRDGGLYRISPVSDALHLPSSWHAEPKKLAIRFSDRLDPHSVEDLNNFEVKVWGLRRTANYGSDHIDEHSLNVESAKLLSDGCTVELTIPELSPTWGISVRVRLRSKDGQEFERLLHGTIHQLEKNK